MTSGGIAGGVEVTILGSGFTGASSVMFGSVAADDFTILSDTALQALAPAQAAGTIDITVVSVGGTSSTSSADHFTYAAPSAPTVTGLSTSTATTAGTTLVTLTGTGFSSASEVDFGGVPASTFVILSDTTIGAIAPAQAVGTVNVVVTNVGGASATSSSNQITYSAASGPSVSSIATSSAPTTGTRGVRLTGSGFLGASSVMFGSVAASFTVYSDTAIVAFVPAQAAGSVSVTVTTPSGTSSAVSFTYFTNAAPVGVNDSYTAHTGTSLVVSAAGLLSNDTDSNGDPLFIDWYSAPTHGTVVVLGDGSFVYTPFGTYLGTDTFTYRASDGVAESSLVTVTLTVVSPQLAEGTPLGTVDAGILTLEELAPILEEAIARWAAAGLNDAQLAELHNVPVSIVDLPGQYLGLANPNVLWLDINAAGFGWYIDPTPADDSEFLAADAAVGSHMDLLTVVEHEMGHVLGLPDVPGDGHATELMSQYLAVGVRRAPSALDVAFIGNPDLIAASLVPVTPARMSAIPSLATGLDQTELAVPVSASSSDALRVLDRFFTALGDNGQDGFSLPSAPLDGIAIFDPAKPVQLNA